MIWSGIRALGTVLAACLLLTGCGGAAASSAQWEESASGEEPLSKAYSSEGHSAEEAPQGDKSQGDESPVQSPEGVPANAEEGRAPGNRSQSVGL